MDVAFRIGLAIRSQQLLVDTAFHFDFSRPTLFQGFPRREGVVQYAQFSRSEEPIEQLAPNHEYHELKQEGKTQEDQASLGSTMTGKNISIWST